MAEEIPHRKYRNRGYTDTYAKRWSDKATSGLWDKTLENKGSYVNRNGSYKNFKIVLNDVFDKYLPGSVLDFGCGNCVVWDGLVDEDNENNFHELDIAEGMIDSAKIKHPNSNFYVGDALDAQKIIPPNKKFDLIFSRGVVMNHMGKDYFSRILENLHSFSDGILMFDYVNSKYFELRPSARKPSFPLYDKDEVLEMIDKTSFGNLEFKIFHEDRRDPIVLLR
jgi:predicted TPR repeat methyltransferase